MAIVAALLGLGSEAFPKDVGSRGPAREPKRNVLPRRMTIVSNPQGSWHQLEKRVAVELRLLGWDVRVLTKDTNETDRGSTTRARSEGGLRARLHIEPVSSSGSFRVVLSSWGGVDVEFERVLLSSGAAEKAIPELAIQIAELVRAQVGEAEARRLLDGPEARTKGISESRSVRSTSSQWELGASLSVLGLIGSVGPSVGPELQARLRLSDSWLIGAAGFVDLAHPQLGLEDGSAAIQAYSLLGHVWWSPFAWGSWQGALGLGGGILVLGIRNVTDELIGSEDFAQAGVVDLRARVDWNPWVSTSFGQPAFFIWVGGSAILPRIEVELDASLADRLAVVAFSSGLGVNLVF